MPLTIAISKEKNGRHEILGARDRSHQRNEREQSQRSLRNEIPQLQHLREIMGKLPLRRKPQDLRQPLRRSQTDLRRRCLKLRWRRSQRQTRNQHLRNEQRQ